MAFKKITRGNVDPRPVAAASKGISGGPRPGSSKSVTGTMSGDKLAMHGTNPNRRSKVKNC
jgi:hypothetical protein